MAARYRFLAYYVGFWRDTYGYGGTIGTFIYKRVSAPRPITAIYCYVERLTSGDGGRRGERRGGRKGMVVVSWDGE